MKVLTVFGTRPEAIKMAPLVHALAQDEAFESRVCVTAQHREMLDQVLRLFEIQPDYDLNIMKPGQGLTEITCRILEGLKPVLAEFKPDVILYMVIPPRRYRPVLLHSIIASLSAMSKRVCALGTSILRGPKKPTVN